MFENTRRNRGVVGGAAALTFALAVAAAVGILPKAGDESPAPQLAAATAAPTVPVPAPEAAPVTEAPAPAPEAPAPTAAPTSRKSPSTSAAPAASEEPAPEASGGSAPAGPAGVPRVQPSVAAVQRAIQGFHQRIPYVTPTPAQVAQFGDQVCSAFDQGQSYDQVKATGLQMAAGSPITISSADADWMIHTAVSLYCPGYAGALS